MSRSCVRIGSWLCENAKTFERDRMYYSSETDLALKLARDFHCGDKLKNVILTRFPSAVFLRSQGH